MALTVLATEVLPQVLAKNVAEGGKYVTTVVGAVPKLMPVVAVPPDMDLEDPDVDRADENHSVVKVSTVLDVLVTVTCTKLPV